jgi:hypothetical protein
MPVYEIYGRELRSELPLPELTPAPPGTDGHPSLTFEHRMPAPPVHGWFTIWYRPDGLPWLRASRTADGYHLQYCKCADFALDLGRGTIAGGASNCAPEMFRHFLVDQVVPLMLSVGAVVLHASAVAIDGALAAFAGPGGSGKSTVALALARLGHRIVSDDGILLVTGERDTIAVPAYAGIRVWPDSEAALTSGLRGSGRPHAHAKQRFRDGLAFAGAGRLTHFFVLDPGAAPQPAFTPLSPRDTAVELVKQAFRLALDDKASLARQLDAVTTAAPRISAWRLAFPRALDDTATLARAVESHVRESAVPEQKPAPPKPAERAKA